MKKRVFVIEGLAFIFIGLVFLFNSFSSITGAVVLENVGVNVSALLGLVFVVAGLLVMVGGRGKYLDTIIQQSDEEETKKGATRFRHTGQLHGRDSVRASNREARHAAREVYMAENGRYPSTLELREFIRSYHERGAIGELLEQYNELKSKK